MASSKENQFSPVVKEGQSVKIIGLGGVGGIVAKYGSIFLASTGVPCRVVLVDGDEFEQKNTSRMFFGSFGNKAEVTRDDLLPRMQDTNVTMVTIPEFITPENIANIIREDDIIIMCVDNHKTRQLISDHCGKLKNITLISGGNDGVGEDSSGAETRGTYGNVQINFRKDGEDVTVPLTKFHPEIAKPQDKAPNELNCTELVTSVPQILFANLAAASGILNALWLHLCDKLPYDEMVFDIAEGITRPMQFSSFNKK